MRFGKFAKCHLGVVFITMFALSWDAPLLAQKTQTRLYTLADYEHAAKFLGFNMQPLVYHSVQAKWIAGERFWFRDAGPEGVEFVLFDAARGTHQSAFDHAKLAAGLSAASGTNYNSTRLPLSTFGFSKGEKSIAFAVKTQGGSCDLQNYHCTAQTKKGGGENTPEEPSPDGKKSAFIREYNLWVRDLTTGKETQLTTDGVKDFGYATDNAGWIHSDRPILLWSPDSKKIATFQQDQRGVGDMFLVETKVGHPALQAWKYPLPGDATVTTIQRVIINLDGTKVVRLQMPPDQHRSTLCDDVECRGSELEDVEWSADGAHLALVST